MAGSCERQRNIGSLQRPCFRRISSCRPVEQCRTVVETVEQTVVVIIASALGAAFHWGFELRKLEIAFAMLASRSNELNKGTFSRSACSVSPVMNIVSC